MSNEEGLTPAQRELESALAAVRPARGGLNRDRVLFRAGQASARRQGLRTTGAMAVLSALLGASAILFALRGAETKVVERVVYREAPEAPRVAVRPVETVAPSPAPASFASQSEYLRLRQAVLEKGLDALPAAPASATRDSLDDLLPSLGRPAREPTAPESLYRKWLINGDRS